MFQLYFERKDLRLYSKEVQDIVAEAAALHATLSSAEAEWRDTQPLLQSKGYMLRPRYRPGWVPPWTLPENAHRFPDYFEDYILPRVYPHLIDATRESDGQLVYVKRVLTGSNEISIATIFSSPGLATDPRNHCVPILDVFTDDVDPDISYMVMPLLRDVDSPPFETVEDIVDFVNQLLEGLVFIHEQGVAHRDCAYKNFMMDAESLYTQACHPICDGADMQGQRRVKRVPRSQTQVKYYYVDFGLSTYFPPGQQRGLVTGLSGHDRAVPELSKVIPYDPFKVDIFILGNMLRTLLIDKYSNIEFLGPLIHTMTTLDPTERVDAAHAQELWCRIQTSLFAITRTWRLQSRRESCPQSLILDGIEFARRGIRAIRAAMRWLEDLQG